MSSLNFILHTMAGKLKDED